MQSALTLYHSYRGTRCTIRVRRASSFLSRIVHDVRSPSAISCKKKSVVATEECKEETIEEDEEEERGGK